MKVISNFNNNKTENNKDYSINNKRDGITPLKRKNIQTDEFDLLSPPIIDRGTRHFLRNRIPVKDLNGIKCIRIRINGEEDKVIDTRQKRVSCKKIF